MLSNKTNITVFEPISEGKTYNFKIDDNSGIKTVNRKVYYDKHDGLYINYKNKRYYECEFTYVYDI